MPHLQILSSLLSFITARGNSTGFSLVSPTKVLARKAFLFTEKFPFIEKRKIG